MAYTTQERANIDVVRGFFQAFRGPTTELNQYINNNFTTDARLIIIRGGPELYAPDSIIEGAPPPEHIADTNAYSDERFSHERQALLPLTRQYIGPSGAQQLIAELTNNFDLDSSLTQFNDLKYIAQDNNVAVYGYLRYVNKNTGNLVRTPLAANIELTDGKINLYHYYSDSFSYAASSREGGSWQGQYPNYDPLSVQWGTREADTLTGDINPQQLRDQLYGYQNNDRLQGGERNDRLWGGSGNDTLSGDNGNDTLSGNIGWDLLTGGAGSDTFVLASHVGIARPGEEGFDTITDFEDGVDRLSLDNGIVDSTDGITVTPLTKRITFNDLTIAQEGANTVITITDTGEKIAVLENVEAKTIDENDFTPREQLPPFRGFPADSENSGNEAQNLAIVRGFFQSFLSGEVVEYMSNNFSENVRYIPIQGDNSYFEVYNPELDAYSVSFSHERFLLTPPTQEWAGITGAQNFIESLGNANDMADPITAFFPEKFVVNGDDIGVFGRFQFRNRSSGQISDTPFAYYIRLHDGKIDFIQFYEDSYAYSYGARQGGTWTRNYDRTLVDFIFGTRSGETLTGGDRPDYIYAYQGNDTLSGEGGDDVLYGGEGNDLFMLKLGQGTDTIVDFVDGEDFLKLPKGVNFKQLKIAQNGSDVDISMAETQEILATLRGLEANTIDQNDFRPIPNGINLFWVAGGVLLAVALLLGGFQIYRRNTNSQ